MQYRSARNQVYMHALTITDPVPYSAYAQILLHRYSFFGKKVFILCSVYAHRAIAAMANCYATCPSLIEAIRGEGTQLLLRHDNNNASSDLDYPRYEDLNEQPAEKEASSNQPLPPNMKTTAAAIYPSHLTNWNVRLVILQKRFHLSTEKEIERL